MVVAGLRAAKSGDLAALRAMVCAQADGVHRFDPRTSVDKHGSSALLWAAGGGQLHVCEYLVLECGVDVASQQPKDGRNAVRSPSEHDDRVFNRAEVSGIYCSYPRSE